MAVPILITIPGIRFLLIKTYINRYTEFAGNNVPPGLHEDLAKLEMMIHKSRGIKNLEILVLSFISHRHPSSTLFYLAFSSIIVLV